MLHQDKTIKGSTDVDGSKELHTVYKERNSLQTHVKKIRLKNSDPFDYQAVLGYF